MVDLPPAMGRMPRSGASASREHYDDRVDRAVDAGTTALGGVLTAGAEILAGTALGAVFELAGGALAPLQLAGAWYQGDQRGLEWDSNVLRGALMALEGRMDEIPRNDMTGLRDGARRVEWLAIRQPAEFECLRQRIASITREGAEAVYRGRDSGPEFEARYQSDLAFRHGVDNARAERRNDPEAFEIHRREARELEEQLRGARSQGGVRA